MYLGPRLARRLTFLPCVWALTLVCVIPAHPAAQGPAVQDPFFIPGRNVNTVGPVPATPSPDFIGDPLYKQQNEVDCDVSPNDPQLIFCADIDYRGIHAFGDSWIGVTISDDGALSWRSRLHPDFPRTASLVGAADPVVATVPGLGLVGFITISRLDGRGLLLLGRWIERNKENGDRYTFNDRVVIGSGTPGRFTDKPAMTAVLSEAGGFTTVGGRAIPNGVVHFGYAIFPGNENNSSSEIYHVMSADYGQTWTSPHKLSASLGINQGIDLAVGGSVVVAAWRRVQDVNEPDAIMFARSTDGGGTWSKGRVLSLGRFFDQDSADLQFRTRSLPALAYDGRAFHAFWAVRDVSSNPEGADDARIVVSSSRDGANWTPPAAVDNHSGRGHQLMPVAAVAGGRVQVNWIDSRNNLPGSFGPSLSDYVYDGSDSTDVKWVYRQSVDVFATQASSWEWDGNGQPTIAFGASKQISRYRMALVDGKLQQVEYNFINARMFKQGAWPFHGDYHAVASQRYRASPEEPGAWIPNTAASDSHAVFYSAFTDNRDVEGYVWAGPSSTPFTPSGSTALQGEPGDETPAVCDPAAVDPVAWKPGNSARSRDQNVYAAATFPGLLVMSPSGSKPTGSLQRAYVVFVHNLTPDTRVYKLTIVNQPPDAPNPGRASWKLEAGACGSSPNCTVLETSIPGGSSISRTVYVESGERRPRIVVQVNEVGGAGQSGSVILNANPNVAEVEQPDGDLLESILDVELYQPDVLQRQTTLYYVGAGLLRNPEVVPVDAEYPRIQYPRIEYPRIQYPRIQYDPVGNTPIEYPRIQYTSIENPRIQYSALTDSEVTGGTTEVTWPVTTDGANTTTAITAKVFVNGGLPAHTKAQLLVTVPYPTMTAASCVSGDTETVVDNQVIVNNIVDPASLVATPDPPDVVNPPSWQPSFFVKPGQTVWVTLRIWGAYDAELARHAGIWVRAQPDPTGPDEVDEDREGTIDVTAPVIDLSGLEALGNVEGNTAGGANVTYTVTAKDEADGDVPVACNPASGSLFRLGRTTVTCTATDTAGNTATARSAVNVTDTAAPALTLLAPPIVEATSPSGATVSFSVKASDVVDATPTVMCTPASGSSFPIGTTQVACTATDDAGNKSSGSFVVTVKDTSPPTSITATVSPSILWPPSGEIVLVTVSGEASDAGSGVATIEWRVVDEYRQYQPSGSITAAGNGSFSFQVPLLAARRGNDKDGRHYTIRITAIDKYGNRLEVAHPPVVNVHDQSGF